MNLEIARVTTSGTSKSGACCTIRVRNTITNDIEYEGVTFGRTLTLQRSVQLTEHARTYSTPSRTREGSETV